jgi:MFS family permease
LRENNKKLGNQPIKPQTLDTYVTPLRQFFGQNPALQKRDSNKTLDGSEIIHLLAERQKKYMRYYSIASWCGFSVGSLLIAYYLFAIYYLFGHEKGLIQSIIITICIIFISHFFFGGLSLKPVGLTRNQSILSIGFGLIYLVASILAVSLSGDLSIYIAAYLWPICAVLVASDFSRNTPDKTASLINPDTVNYQNQHESPEVTRRDIFFNIQWSFFRYLALTCAFGSFLISLFSGLYLPLSITVVILVSSVSISGYLPLNRFGYYSGLFLGYIIVLALCVIVAFITPIFWGKSADMLSTTFVQKDYERISYSTSLTDSQGLYFAFEGAKRRSDDYNAFKSWLDLLPASENRIYFDVQDDLAMVRNIGQVLFF